MNFSKPSEIRTINRLRVLNTIRTNEPVSRADIARLLDLNKPSCSEIVQGLLQEALIVEEQKAVTANGRRPTPLVLNRSGKLVVAIDMGSRVSSLMIADLKGNLLRYERYPTPANPKPQEFCYQLLKSLLRITKGATLAGIAISLDGIISKDGQNVIKEDAWGWDDIPLATAFERNMKIPAILANSTLAMVHGERWFSKEVPDTFLFVNWGEHISDCLVNGSTLLPGQLGHMKVSEQGLCQCGEIGCLETISSGWAISSQFGGKSVKQLCQERPEGFDAVMKKACTVFAHAVATALAVTGTTQVIIGGGLANNSEYFSLVERAIIDRAPRRLGRITVKASALGDKAGMLAPVATALDHFIFQKTFLESLDI